MRRDRLSDVVMCCFYKKITKKLIWAIGCKIPAKEMHSVNSLQEECALLYEPTMRWPPECEGPYHPFGRRERVELGSGHLYLSPRSRVAFEGSRIFFRPVWGATKFLRPTGGGLRKFSDQGRTYSGAWKSLQTPHIPMNFAPSLRLVYTISLYTV